MGELVVWPKGIRERHSLPVGLRVCAHTPTPLPIHPHILIPIHPVTLTPHTHFWGDQDRSSRELRTTVTELKAINPPATAGLRLRP
jgi:hypothetical protein